MSEANVTTGSICNTTVETKDEVAVLFVASELSGLLMLIIFMCSLTMCTAVLWALWKTKQLSYPVYRLVAFLLINELLVRVFGSPLIMTSMMAGRWLYGYNGCVFYGFTMTWLGVAATSLFTCIAVERYIIVCNSSVKHRLTPGVASITALLCNLHGLCWALLPLFGINRYVFEPSGLSCTPSWSPDYRGYMFGLFSVCCLVPLSVSGFCYKQIYTMVSRASSNMRRSTSSMPSIVSAESGVAKVMILTMMAFLVSWMPYSVIGMLKVVGLSEEIYISKEVTLIPLVTAKTAGLWHPIIFSFKNKDIKDLFLKQCAKLKFFSIWSPNRALQNTENVPSVSYHIHSQNTAEVYISDSSGINSAANKVNLNS